MIHVEARNLTNFRTLLGLRFPSKILNNATPPPKKKKLYPCSFVYFGVKLCLAKGRMETGDGLESGAEYFFFVFVLKEME